MRLLQGLWLAGMLVVPFGYAEVRSGDVNANVEPAAGAEEIMEQDTLLDRKVEQDKRAKVQRDDGIAANAALVVRAAGGGVDDAALRVLSDADVAGYKKAFAQARQRVAPDAAAVKDKLLWGDVRAEYLLHKNGATFDELNRWLKDYRDLAASSEIYAMADARRVRPREVCKTETVTQVVKAKKKGGKDVTKKRKKRTCKTVGSWGPAPVVPLAVELKEVAQAAREAGRQQELGKLSDEGRAVLGQSWRARVRGDFSEALKVLLAPKARVEAGTSNWQGELVKVADAYHAKRDWAKVVKAAEPATEVQGAGRDDARWLAGYAHYQLGHLEDAAEYWEQLVKDEPVGGKHYARGAWWGARAFTELKQPDRARKLLQAGAHDSVSFYGQLCSARLGQNLRLGWQVPDVDSGELAQLKRVPAARRGMALAQLGEVVLAQRTFKAANSDLPYQATRALAGVAVRTGLPATALQAGKELKERGEIVPMALFPLPDAWAPTGGWTYDRALTLGIMRQESAFQPQVGSRVGAQGLMQLMPTTAAYVARMTGRPMPARSDLHEPALNLALAQDYLEYLHTKLDGNVMLVVAAYNGGIGNVQRWLNRGVTPGHDPVLWLESIPFDETRDYVEKVFANYWLYQQRLRHEAWSLQALARGTWPVAKGS